MPYPTCTSPGPFARAGVSTFGFSCRSDRRVGFKPVMAFNNGPNYLDGSSLRSDMLFSVVIVASLPSGYGLCRIGKHKSGVSFPTGRMISKQMLDAAALFGMGFILLEVAVINIFSSSVSVGLCDDP